MSSEKLAKLIAENARLRRENWRLKSRLRILNVKLGLPENRGLEPAASPRVEAIERALEGDDGA